MDKDYKKLYEDALKRATKIHSKERITGIELVTCEEIFPELKESEDEKMREMAIKAVHAPEAQSCIKSWGVNPDDVIAWLEKQGEQNSSWSEGDELMFISTIQSLKFTNGACDMKIDWLKSLKPHWKPSEEQLRAIINSAQGLYQCKEKEVLLDLYEQLKNL